MLLFCLKSEGFPASLPNSSRSGCKVPSVFSAIDLPAGGFWVLWKPVSAIFSGKPVNKWRFWLILADTLERKPCQANHVELDDVSTESLSLQMLNVVVSAAQEWAMADMIFHAHLLNYSVMKIIFELVFFQSIPWKKMLNFVWFYLEVLLYIMH